MVCYTILASNCSVKNIVLFSGRIWYSKITHTHAYPLTPPHTHTHKEHQNNVKATFNFNQNVGACRIYYSRLHMQLKCKLYWHFLKGRILYFWIPFLLKTDLPSITRAKIYILNESLYIFISCTQMARVKILLTKTLLKYCTPL